jgi:hypothetical protein
MKTYIFTLQSTFGGIYTHEIFAHCLRDAKDLVAQYAYSVGATLV